MLPRSYPFRDSIRVPFSDTRLTEMCIAEGVDSLSGPLAGGVAFASPPGGDSSQNPASAITCCAVSVARSRRPLASQSLRGKGGFEAPLHLSWRPRPLAPGHCPACGFRRLLPPSTKPRSNKSYQGGWGIKSRLATSRVGNRGGLRPARPLPPE